MEFILVKLQAYSVQTRYVLQTDFATYPFRKMFRKIAALEEQFEQVHVVTAF